MSPGAPVPRRAARLVHERALHPREIEDVLLGHPAVADVARTKPAGFKVPREIRFTAELPRTPTGKMRKHVLTDDPATS